MGKHGPTPFTVIADDLILNILKNMKLKDLFLKIFNKHNEFIKTFHKFFPALMKKRPSL